MVTDPAHRALWAELPEKSGFNVLIEQFLISCLGYHRIDPLSPYRGMARLERRVAQIDPSLFRHCSTGRDRL